MRSPSGLSWLWLSLLIIGLDQWSKWLAIGALNYGQSVPVIEGFWNWTLVHNYGGAFSLFAQHPGWQKYFFLTVGVIFCLIILVWLKREPRSHWQVCLPLALVVGGALGNMIDRVRFGYVVDFIHWYVDRYSWPVFNIADSAITVAAVWLIIHEFVRNSSFKSKG
jgi:signal peptidase II